MRVNQHLKEEEIDFSSIFLDPNNPRFWSEKNRQIPDIKIPDDRVQATAQASISQYGIDELYESILRNGFLPLDRIVVRPIDGHAGQFVVVEGNRRFAALTKLRDRIAEGTIDEEHIDEEYLQKLKEETDALLVLVYKGDRSKDISWLLQGVRHISGIKNWAPAQRARLVADQIDGEGLGFREAGQQFGLTAHAVGRLYRAYKALEQMREDEEFQGKADNRFYSLFEESIANKDVRQWLGWDDSDLKFTNEDNLKQFYAWITPSAEREPPDNRRLHDPKHVKKLAGLVADEGNSNLLARFDQWELSIEEAARKASRAPQTVDWKSRLADIKEMLDGIPHTAIIDEPEEFLEALSALEETFQKSRRMAEALLTSEE